MAEINPPGYLQALNTHRASTDRGMGNFLMGGLLAASSLKSWGGVHPSYGAAANVTQNGTPNMSVNVGSFAAAIPGTENITQGTYFVYNDGTVNKAIAAASGVNPRKDAVIAQVLDAEYSGASNLWQIAVVTGTPAASPVLPTLPVNSLLLAEVNVLTSATSITTANITGRQVYASALGGMQICTSATRPSLALIPRGTLIWELDTSKLLSSLGSNYGLNYVDTNDTGAWVSWTPSINGTLGNGALACRYKLLGKTLMYVFKYTLGSTSTIGNGSFTLPFGRLTPAASGGDGFHGVGRATDASAGTNTTLFGLEVGSGSVTPFTSSSVATSATGPFTWTTSDVLTMCGTLEIA
jgi:hypothetical protein